MSIGADTAFAVDTTTVRLFVEHADTTLNGAFGTPILEAWARDDDAGGGPRAYAAGSWGPAAASALVARDGFAWAEEQ